MKMQVVSNDHYRMSIERHEGLWFYHVDVEKWSPKVKEQYLKHMEEVHQVFQPLYAIPPESGDKMDKFGKITGFHTIGTYLCDDGVERKVYEYKGVK